MDYGEFSLLRTGTTMEVTIKNAMEIKKDIGMKEMFRTVSSLTDQRLDKATSKGIFYNAGRPEDPANSQQTLLYFFDLDWNSEKRQQRMFDHARGIWISSFTRISDDLLQEGYIRRQLSRGKLDRRTGQFLRHIIIVLWFSSWIWISKYKGGLSNDVQRTRGIIHRWTDSATTIPIYFLWL